VSEDRLEFIFKYVYPRNHADLLSVRKTKKNREGEARSTQQEHGHVNQKLKHEPGQESVNPLRQSA